MLRHHIVGHITLTLTLTYSHPTLHIVTLPYHELYAFIWYNLE